MHFGFALDLSDIDLLNVDLLDQRYTHLDLFVSKTSWRRLQDMSSRRLEDVFSVTIFRLPRRLQDVFKTYLQDVFKTSWKTKNCYAEDMLKTSSRRLENQQMFAGKYLYIISYVFSPLRGLWVFIFNCFCWEKLAFIFTTDRSAVMI